MHPAAAAHASTRVRSPMVLRHHLYTFVPLLKLMAGAICQPVSAHFDAVRLRRNFGIDIKRDLEIATTCSPSAIVFNSSNNIAAQLFERIVHIGFDKRGRFDCPGGKWQSKR